MKLSGRTQPLSSRYTTLDSLALIQRLGFDGVEICLEIDEVAPDQLTAERAAAIGNRARALGLDPCVIGYHKDYIYDDTLFDLTQTAIRLAPVFGAKILIFAGTPPREGDADAWQRMLTRTRLLVRLAEDHNVILAQEFEPGFVIGSTADLLRLFDAIPSPNLAANLDLGHVFLCDPNPIESIRQVGSKIVHGHIENMRSGVHDHLLPSEGDMDLDAFLAALKGVGFEGALALDLYKFDYEAVAPQAVAFIRQKMAA
jgi:sugar phosphate isomerase/epimerase